MAVISGALGSSENSALQGRLASSFQRTVTDAALDATVTGPAVTPDPSNGMAAVKGPMLNSKTASGQDKPARRQARRQEWRPHNPAATTCQVPCQAAFLQRAFLPDG